MEDVFPQFGGNLAAAIRNRTARFETASAHAQEEFKRRARQLFELFEYIAHVYFVEIERSQMLSEALELGGQFSPHEQVFCHDLFFEHFRVDGIKT